MFTGRLYIHMGDEIQGLFLFVGVLGFAEGLHDLDLITLPLMAAVCGIRI